jgi:hypothetical protein
VADLPQGYTENTRRRKKKLRHQPFLVFFPGYKKPFYAVRVTYAKLNMVLLVKTGIGI